MRTQLKLHLSDKASYNRGVARHYLFSILNVINSCIEYDMRWWKSREGEAQLCYDYLYGTVVPPVETQSLPAQEKVKEMISHRQERLKAKIMLTTLPLKLETLDRKWTVMRMMVKEIPRKDMGCSEMQLPSLCDLNTAQYERRERRR